MNTDREKAIEALAQINPAQLDYQDWLRTGMALKHCGCSVEDWNAWSRADTARYNEAICIRKWNTFNESSTPVTLGTLVKLCIDHGGSVGTAGRNIVDRALEWDDVIGGVEKVPISIDWVRSHDMPEESADWNQKGELKKYLETLFQSEEYVGYVTESWKNEEGKYLPKKGIYTRTAGELISELERYPDVAHVVGDWEKTCGAWIRFNPLDGKGCSDINITAYRFALVESDALSIEKQHDLYLELELPIAALVHSGGKSLHAIVRIDAKDRAEYKERVDLLYSICKKSGLEIDVQNKNPSRLSRMPGITRNDKKQWLVATNIGKSSWQEWREWIEALNDDLPDAENLSSRWDNLPPLANAVIHGILRHGHKMLVAGPSKAGKSFLLIELAIAIAEGRTWLGWLCAQGRILYVNLELDSVSCLHRFKDVYTALGYEPDNISNIDIWNLRGKSMPMDKLAPRLIRRAAKKKYIAVIIDPIYKVITGDENSANEMANFCNQFDRICAELGTATIYCHHHSKGAQGAKRAADRASGSGVFARDPDATLDIIELILDRKRREVITDRIICDKAAEMLDHERPCWRSAISEDDKLVLPRLIGALQGFDTELCGKVVSIQKKEYELFDQFSAWRIEGTLREFPTFKPRRCLFRYPIHCIDNAGLLIDAKAEGELLVRTVREKDTESKQDKTKTETTNAFESLSGFTDEPVTLKAMAEYLNVEESNMRKRLKRTGLMCKKGIVLKIEENEEL